MDANPFWWTAAQDKVLIDNPGQTFDILAKMVSRVGPARTAQGVKNRRAILGLEQVNPWLIPERVARLTELYDKGYSGSQIAKALGNEFGLSLSRNSIIGKLHRLGLARPERCRVSQTLAGRAAKKEQQRRKPPPPKARVFQHGGGCATTAPQAPQDIKTAGPTVISKNLKITDPSFGGCRWPTFGDGADATFCCAPTDGTYCAPHARRAYVATPIKGPKSNVELARILRRYA